MFYNVHPIRIGKFIGYPAKPYVPVLIISTTIAMELSAYAAKTLLSELCNAVIKISCRAKLEIRSPDSREKFYSMFNRERAVC